MQVTTGGAAGSLSLSPFFRVFFTVVYYCRVCITYSIVLEVVAERFHDGLDSRQMVHCMMTYEGQFSVFSRGQYEGCAYVRDKRTIEVERWQSVTKRLMANTIVDKNN